MPIFYVCLVAMFIPFFVVIDARTALPEQLFISLPMVQHRSPPASGLLMICDTPLEIYEPDPDEIAQEARVMFDIAYAQGDPAIRISLFW